MGSYQLIYSFKNLSFSFLLIFFVACGPEPEIITPDISANNSVLVINEGNYTWQNSEISLINTENKHILNNVFAQINNEKLGDVAQSAFVTKKYIYLIVNNSGRIAKLDRETLTKIDELSGFISPRYMVSDGNLAYISDLYAAKISVINLHDFSLMKTIPAPKSSEALLLLNNELYISNWSGGNAVFVYNLDLEVYTDTIKLAAEPESMVLDKDNHIWVLCSGGFLHTDFPALFQVSNQSKQILQEFTFSSKDFSTKALRINSARDTLYFLHAAVYRMDIYEQALPSESFISSETGRVFYGLDIDTDNSIWLSDAGNFVEASEIFHFSPQGIKLESYLAGVNAVHFYRF
jgi:hypothetical protein